MSTAGRTASFVGVDTGGTFTDVVTEDGRIAKVPSANDSASVVASAIEELGAAAWLAHGTTVATNALLERAGAVVALVTDAGFADVIEIGRQDRPSLYDLFADRPEPLVPRHLRLEVGGRVDAGGALLGEASGAPPIPNGIEAVAITLLHADRWPEAEQRYAATLRASGWDVSASHEVSPEYREYERTVTTVVNAYLRPACRRYLPALGRLAPEVTVMTSAGGRTGLADAVEFPVRLLLSGPAAGVLAAARAALDAGYPDAVSFDMGGTSTDVCLVLGGVPEAAAERTVAGWPIRVPSLDVHTIGAGGGSLAALDAGGALVVGPRSAGARPGPACYGLGGTRPTVTDADLALGRIDPHTTLAGIGRLDRSAAERALTSAGVSAAGVVAVVDQAMTNAVRKVTVERGVDPRSTALVAFGGAGPLHACAIAGTLGMPAVIVPPRAGVLSAVGLLTSPRQVDLVRSWPEPASTEGLTAALGALADEASGRLASSSGAVTVEVAVDCRYAGQSHELTVPSVGAFAEAHQRRNGYARAGAPVEVVAIRATARQPSPLRGLGPPSLTRQPLVGPRVAVEPDCTVWVPEGWRASVTDSGSWVLVQEGA